MVTIYYFGHFNVKFLGEYWKLKKDTFENLDQWWDVSKANIRIFCQNYTSYSTTLMKTTVKSLQRDIAFLEKIHFE